MTKSKGLVVFGAVAIGIALTYTVIAQQTQNAQPKRVPASVALVDVAYILSQNGAIDTQLAQMSDKYSKMMQDLEKETQEISKVRDLLTTYDRNSEKYRETEQLMLSKSSDLSSRRMMIVKEATEERMKMFNNAYNQILSHTQRCAQYFGMTIVLNYDRTKLSDSVPLFPNPQQYEAFMQQYTQYIGARTVVWADTKAVDLTGLVLKEIQKADPSTIRKTDTTVQNGQTAAPAARVGSKVNGQ
ncbi:MAG: OmpH family outer membrane protein [Planctomycetia bacterium]|nr:OmpH family outer membrane protein [Planctomycetia bacterium]